MPCHVIALPKILKRLPFHLKEKPRRHGQILAPPFSSLAFSPVVLLVSTSATLAALILLKHAGHNPPLMLLPCLVLPSGHLSI